ncbi:MAG: outer membrane lipoprotein carrier protein LolA [Oligoflexia bacterium]|nr:outer membrane lipoprotein carrier protein LolA [Oligoflexia bacterium]
MNRFLILFYTVLALSAPLKEELKLLKEVEKKYSKTSGITMEVTKKLTIALLEKEKKSFGEIKIKKGGFFKWHTVKPEENTILLTPKAVWVIDAPMDDQDRTIVLKSKRPKKNQSPAIVAFLMGKGGLTKSYHVVNTAQEEDNNEKIRYYLKSKTTHEAVTELEVVINKKTKNVEKVIFVDHIGNNTVLEFDAVEFDKKFDKNEFEFDAPKDAEITILE